MQDFSVRPVFFVADTPRAMEFYTRALGFNLDWTYEQDGRPYVVQVSLFGVQIILNQKETTDDPRPGHGRIFIGLDDAQSDILLRHVRGKGIAAACTEWGEPTMAIHDLDLNEIYVWLSDAERIKWQQTHAGNAMQLVPIQRGGEIPAAIELPAEAAGAIEATAALYEKVGHVQPWICYIAIDEGRPVGTCGFTSAPVDGRVELAYFTFPAFEGRGIATKMADSLVRLAAGADPSVTVIARTLVERNASHRVLEKQGFTCIGTVESPEDGTVLEWQKDASQ